MQCLACWHLNCPPMTYAADAVRGKMSHRHPRHPFELLSLGNFNHTRRETSSCTLLTATGLHELPAMHALRTQVPVHAPILLAHAAVACWSYGQAAVARRQTCVRAQGARCRGVRVVAADGGGRDGALAGRARRIRTCHRARGRILNQHFSEALGSAFAGDPAHAGLVNDELQRESTHDGHRDLDICCEYQLRSSVRTVGITPEPWTHDLGLSSLMFAG